MEIIYTKTRRGNESIICDGNMYRRVHVSQNGDISYRCISGGSCRAAIVTDSDGVYVKKQVTFHSYECNERKAKIKNEPSAGGLSNETISENVRILTVDPKKTSSSQTHTEKCQEQRVLAAYQKKTSSVSKTQEPTKEIVYSETRLGNRSIVYDGFMYRKSHVSLKGNVAWRCCTNSNCMASIVMKADGINVVKMNNSHLEECYVRRQRKLHVACRKKTDNKRPSKQKAKTQRKLHVRLRRISNDTHLSRTFRDSGNITNRTPAAASKAPVSVTPVSAPSVVSRQHEDDEIPMVTETFDHAMSVPQVFIKTEVDVSSTTNVESQEINPADGIRKELDNLFRKQQTQIEKANKQNELLLAAVLSKRQKKAKKEAKKLSQMQKELAKLDNSLTADVTLIRDRIENACREFVEAQERYNKAEKELNDAKLDLQQKSELREKLAEHVNTVINQKEVRKAGKLQEFMTELEIESPSSEATPLNSHPPQSSFGIHDVNTFHSPLTSPESSTSSSTSRIPFTPYSQSTNKPASSLLQSASSGTQQHSLVPQITSSNIQPSSSVLEPDSSVPYPVSLSVAPQVAIRQEYLTTVNRMDTESPISIHSDTSWDENSDIESPIGL